MVKNPLTVAQKEAKLFRHVQFIYELELGLWELSSLGAKYVTGDGDLRNIFLLDVADEMTLLRRTAYFERIGDRISDYAIITSKNRTRSINQYLTHWIYPYKGKFHPQMVRALLNIIGLKPQETVLDPFIGSGTTALEAQLLGINCIGFDISPLCVLQTRVKTESLWVLDRIQEAKEQVLSAVKPSLFKGSVPMSVTTAIEQIQDEQVRNFYKLAELLAHSDVVRRKREFVPSFIRNLQLMLASVRDYAHVVKELGLQLGRVDIRQGDARYLPLPDESVDGIITSPPYSIALDYVANDAHALKVLGYDLKELREQFIGVRGIGAKRLALYNEDMVVALSEMYRVLKPNRYLVLVLGNATYQGKEVKTVEFVTDVCRQMGLDIVRSIEKTIFGLYNVMQSEKILVFRKG